MKFASLASFAFLALASASPRGRISSPKAVSQLATYDDLASVPAISQINPVGTYKGLKYNSWNVLQQGVAGIITTGIQPQSGVNVAANGITDSVLNGAPAFTPASPYKSFNFKSLYFACVANSVESVAGVPQQCTVAFTAYLPGSNVAYQTINQQFNPTNAVLSKMTRVDFPKSWINMGKVSVAVVQSTLSSSLTGLLIDNLSYDLYSTSK